jgi:acyl dehydratase
MSLATLAAGSTLPPHRVTAQMPADTTENKIHEDELARDLGFRGGLVPGVTVYAWMTHPVVAALGVSWLERGTFSARFRSPVYFDEAIAIEAAITERTDQGVAIEVRAVNGAGELCATATFGLAEGAAPAAPDPGGYPAAALPLPDERPRVSREALAARPVLGTPELALDASTARAFLDRVGEPLAIYGGPAAPAHPGLYLHEANRALSRNVIVSPWIHVESEGRHLGALRVGERLETRARVGSLFERKGHQFVELDLLLLAEGKRPVAHVRHKAIYQLRGSSEAKTEAR